MPSSDRGTIVDKILLCGVGGQGTILAAHILADVALRSGTQVKVSEIHGMAQRGGAVSTMVALGADVKSMVIGQGEADIVVAFEELEALRNLSALKQGGSLIVNEEVIKPASVLTGKAHIPAHTAEVLQGADALLVPAEATAREAGSSKAANVVLLGALSAFLGFSEDTWLESIRSHVPPKTIDIICAAFQAGRQFACEPARR